jgi:hypothetical protein
MRRRLIAALLAAGLLAAPAGALAQSAGDDQYADPFGNSDQPSQNDGGSTGSPTPSSDPTVAAPAADGAEVAADTGSGAATLPHTGFPAGLSATLGVLLIVLGASVWHASRSTAARR